MNTRQQDTITPLDIVRSDKLPGELTAHRHTGAFQGNQPAVNFISGRPMRAVSAASAHRTAYFEPSLNNCS